MFNNVYAGTKVLVTGHTGFKGSWLVAWLQKLGAEVIGISLEPDTDPSHYQLLNLDMQSNFVDIRDSQKIEVLIKGAVPDVVFHLAAQPLVRYSYKKPLYTLETNVIGTANVLNACRGIEGLKAVVVVTTDKCYENREWVWGYRENDPMGGHDPYSVSKGCAELVVASFRNSYFNLDKYGIEHNALIASARAGNVIGGGDWAEDRLIPDIIRSVTKGDKVQIRNPNATRPWQHVLECLSGYLCLGEKLLRGERRFAEAWNFAPTDDGTATVLDIVQKMRQEWPKCNYQLETNINHLHEANLLKLDCSKANAVLRWSNVWDLDMTVKRTTNWYRNFYENSRINTVSDIDTYTKDANALAIEWAK